MEEFAEYLPEFSYYCPECKETVYFKYGDLLTLLDVEETIYGDDSYTIICKMCSKKVTVKVTL